MMALEVVLALLCLAWIAQAALTLVHLSEIRTLADLSPSDPPRWPRISAIVPARDEAAAIGTALASRLADDYPDLELVVVDDRSADDTPRIIADLAEKDPRIVPVHINELPHGWLGKVHALEQGVHAATGEWLLVSDADIHLAPGALRRALALCEADGLDFLALVPEFRSRSLAVNVLWATFMRVLAMSVSPKAVRDPGSKVAMGSGGFMLVRRSAYDATPGFEHIRLETGDDVALGTMLKQAGARCEFINGRGAAWLPSYPSVRAFLRGVEKNGATFVGTPFPLVAIGMLTLGVLEYSPIAALAVGLVAHVAWLAALGAGVTALATFTQVAALWTSTCTVGPALLWPLGWLGMAFGVTRSVWLAHRNGGVWWRDTFYSREELLAGQRFRLL